MMIDMHISWLTDYFACEMVCHFTLTWNFSHFAVFIWILKLFWRVLFFFFRLPTKLEKMKFVCQPWVVHTQLILTPCSKLMKTLEQHDLCSVKSIHFFPTHSSPWVSWLFLMDATEAFPTSDGNQHESL